MSNLSLLGTSNRCCFLIVPLAILVLFIACEQPADSDKKKTWDPSVVPTSVEDVEAYMEGKTGTLDNPLPVKVNMYLSDEIKWSLLSLLVEKGIYITLDLSDCTLVSGSDSDSSFRLVWDSNSEYINRAATLIRGISLPRDTTEIGRNGIATCTNLAWIKLPVGITRIGLYAFSGCSSLTSIELPAGITEIAEGAFNDCASLTSIKLPAGITAIGNDTFFGCANLAVAELPAGITRIGFNAFRDCTSLVSITLPAGLTEIASFAFWGCTSLASIKLPAGLTSIGDDAFQGCTSLNAIVFPASLTSIGYGAFNGCTGLTEITFLSINPPGVGSSQFENTNLKLVKVLSAADLFRYRIIFLDIGDIVFPIA